MTVYSSVEACVIALALVMNLPSIAARHDVTEQQYLKLAEEFVSVGTVVGMGTGTLVAPQWVLTAAHVTEFFDLIAPDKDKRFFVLNGKPYKILEAYYPPERVHRPFTSGDIDPEDNVHDIALLELSEAVDDVKPAVIYTGRDEIGKEHVLVGCGSFWADGRTGATVAQAMAKQRGTRRAGTNRFDEAILDGRVLVLTFDAPGSKTVTKFEAGGFGGDSGGPMFLKVGAEWQLAGVAAMGESGEGDLLGDYGDKLMATRVSMYVDWIRATISRK